MSQRRLISEFTARQLEAVCEFLLWTKTEQGQAHPVNLSTLERVKVFEDNEDPRLRVFEIRERRA